MVSTKLRRFAVGITPHGRINTPLYIGSDLADLGPKSPSVRSLASNGVAPGRFGAARGDHFCGRRFIFAKQHVVRAALIGGFPSRAQRYVKLTITQ